MPKNSTHTISYIHDESIHGKSFFIAVKDFFYDLWNFTEYDNFTIQTYFIMKHKKYQYKSNHTESFLKMTKNIHFKYSFISEYFDNHLGDYFRNLYHILKFISNSKSAEKMNNSGNASELKIDRKYQNYTDILQSQMSFPELFYSFIIVSNSEKVGNC